MDLSNVIRVLGLLASAALIAVLFLLVFRNGLGAGAGMWEVAFLAAGLLVYVSLQAATALSHPPGRLTVVAFLDITFSVVPLILCGIAIFMTREGIMALSEFQTIVLALTTVATVLDLIFFGVVMYFFTSETAEPAAAKPAGSGSGGSKSASSGKA